MAGHRILMIAPTPFFADRGCHVRILGEAKALIASGNQLVLCTYPLGRDIEGVPTARPVPVPWYKKLAAGPSFHKFYIDLLLLWKSVLVCRSFHPEVIHAHLHEGIVIGAIISKLFGVPLVADLQGSLTRELRDHRFIPERPWFLRLMYSIEKRINQLPAQLVCSSTHTAGMCVDTFGIAPDRVISIIDGADLELFAPQEADPALRTSLGIGADEKVIVFVGVLTEYQGIDLLLEAIPAVVQAVPEAKFLIIGFPNEAFYRQKAHTLGVADRVCFPGKIPYGETPRYLSLAYGAVSPKIATTEANLKLLTYMAMGLPTVVFESPVNREILGNLGVYAKMADAKALAEALLVLLQDPTYARQLGEQSRQKAVQDYAWLTAGKRLTTIYDSLLRATKHGKG
jgi:glycosyltransferase involved in cell wall biosynthesis